MQQWRWCTVCWKEFVSPRKNKMYCSSACRQKVYRHRRWLREHGEIANRRTTT